MDFIGTILEFFKCVGPPIRQYVRRHRKLSEIMKNLERALQELNSKKEDVEATLKAECGLEEKQPSNEVNDWLENVKRINSEAQSIEKEVKKGKYFSRARLGRVAEEKIQEVKDYHRKGSSFTSLVIAAPPSRGEMLPTATLVGEKTKKIVERIWEDLMGDKVPNIGVWGMGGIGKTTIMKEIHNRLQKETNKFDAVIWVTVSQPLNLIKLQTEIATASKERLPDDEDTVRRAGRLLGMLKAKAKFVLILDDMWEAFRLQEVGIPEPSKENGCKLVITTRSYRVCRSMKCKPVEVELLSKEEAFNLFIDGVGSSILQVPTLNKEIINEVVEECGRLPLAIVVVAASMSGEEEIYEWQNVLNELRGQLRSLNDDVDTKVFGRLEFSYQRLKDEKLQQCFLYCALYPEDFAIPKDELIDYWIAEGFMEEVKGVQAKYDRGHTILNRLVNCCLLESAEGGSRVKMHDLIRDMALRITRKSPLFMVKAGERLLEFPGEQEWQASLKRVSLMESGIEEIPSNMSPHCEILSTLLLQKNRNLGTIPECFFVHMHGLKILNLSDTAIEVLPSSVSDLMNLRSLLLRNCGSLERVPSLAKLLALQYLDLEETCIEEVPEGMEMLENLSYLCLSSPRLEKFPAGIFPRLRNLYKLELYFGREALRETMEEAVSLCDRLDTFVGRFSNLKDFNMYVKSTDGRRSKNYYLLLVPTSSLQFPLFDGQIYDKSVLLTYEKICEGEERVVVPADVRILKMSNNSDVASLNDVLPRDQGLVNIGKFSHDLKVLSFVLCHNLKNLFSLRLLPALQNLERLEVEFCNSIEEIVAVEDEETEKELATNTIINTVTLPRLRELSLRCLPVLKSVCSDNAVLVCTALQEIVVDDCPSLKRLSVSLPPPPALKVIEIEKETWESLEWDQANAKDVLAPYCRFQAPWSKIIAQLS